jgi:Tfp pilus assembly protein PilN
VVATGTAKTEHPDRLAAALGLALQGLGVAGLSLNFLAASQGQARSRHMRRIASAVSGVCVAASAILGLHGMLEVRQRSVRVLRSLEQQERLYQTLRPEARALLQQEEHLERRNLQLGGLVGESPALTQLVARISDALPDEAWLVMLECSKAGLINGVIEGRARSFQDVTKFMEQLKTVAEMTTVKPLSTNVTTDDATGKEVIAFSIQVQRPLPSSTSPAPEGGE